MKKHTQYFLIAFWLILLTIIFLGYITFAHAQRKTVQPQHWLPLGQQEPGQEPATPVKKMGIIWFDPNGNFVAKDYNGNKTYFAGTTNTYANFYEWSLDGNIIYVDGPNRSVGFFTNSPSSSAYIQLSDKFIICKTFTSAGIQACVDALSSEGGEVLLLKGKYMVNSAITSSIDNIIITGSNWCTELWVDANETWATEGGAVCGDIINLTNSANSIIRNLKINGRCGSTAFHSVYHAARVGINGKIENVWFYECEGSNYCMARTGNYGQIKGCIFESCRDGSYLAGAYSNYRVSIVDNIFIGNYPYKADLALDWTHASIASDNIFYNEDGHGQSHACIGLYDAYNCIVSNNDMFDICRGIVNSYAHTAQSQYNNIIGNNISYAEEYGIYVITGSYLNIVGNYIYDTDTDAIDILIGYSTNGCYYNNISNNSIMTYIPSNYGSVYGIQLNEGADWCKVSGNLIGCQKDYGIYISGADYTHITDNYIYSQSPSSLTMFMDNAIYIDENSTNISLWGNTIYDPNNAGPISNNATSNEAFEVYGNAIIDGSVTTDFLDMEEITPPSTPPTNTLRLYTEAIKGFSFIKYYDDTGMKRQLIRDSMILVKNIRGTTIAANRIVYATGSEDNIPTVDTAKADSISTMPAIGVTVESIANGAYGRVMQVGLLENINTSTLVEGDILYVSDSTAGIPVTTAPITPSLTQEIGTCLVSDPNTGAIQVVARGLTGDEYGTAQNIFYIGDGSEGTKTLTFNGTNSASVQWDSNNSNYAFVPDGGGTLKFWTYQDDDIADDGTVNLPDATSGMIFACITDPNDTFADASGFWMVSHDGACTLVSGTAGTTAAADTDGDLCVYDGGTYAILKSRMGNLGEIRAFYFYN